MSTIRIEVQGQAFETALPGRPVTIGRADGVDLKLDCDGVAAQHATIDLLPDGRHRVKDMGSGKETRVNGVAVRQVSLSAGDVVEIGAARITFLGGAPAAAEPEPIAAVAPPTQPTQPAPARPVPVKVAAKPEPAAATPAPAKPRAVTASDDPEPAQVGPEVGSASTDTAPMRARGRKQTNRLIVPLVVVALLGAGAIVLANFMGSESAAIEGRAYRQFEEARTLLEQKDYEGAKAIFQALADDTDAGEFRRKALSRLDHIRTAEGLMDKELARLSDQGLNYTASALAAQRSLFIDDFGETNVERFDSIHDDILAGHANWTDTALSVHRQETQDLIKDRQFGAALEGWRDFGRAAPPAIDLGPQVEQGVTEVQMAAADAASRLIAEAHNRDRRNGPTSAGRFLADRVAGWIGTQAEIEIRAEIRRYAVEAAAAVPVTPPTPPVRPEPTPPPEEGPPPREVPTVPATPDHEARAKAALEAAGTAIAAYKLEDAKAALDAVHGGLPAGEWKVRIDHWRTDVALADAAFTALIADISENPRRYRGVRLGSKLRASLVGADRETIATQVRGGTSKFKWTRVTVALMADLLGRMKPEGDRALEVAALLHLIGGSDESDAWLYAAGQTGCSTDTVFPIIARWRGEDLPTDGYVVYDERYVTVERHDFLVREAKIADALGRVDHDDPKVRATAYAELLLIGEPAAERFRVALDKRRNVLVDQIAGSKSFKSGKNKNKLFAALQQRRRNALALIYDAAAYPYPNPSKKNQKRVEELVDLVREVWERPFDLITQWDKKLGDELLVVTEVDEVIAQLDSGYQPDLDVIKDRINKAIDMPSHTPGSQEAGDREYSLKALKYNEELQCTGTPQEKDNTLIVNEYRMMMGLRAVKINERLLRAARGHSKHMRAKNYFAHDVPAAHATPQNKSPGNRARTQGYGGGVGENIATGPGTGRGAFWAWFGSSGHHRNMLGRGWSEMGCGRSGRYWTQLFGAAGGYGLTPPAPLPDPDPPFAPEDEAPLRGPRGARLPGEDGLFDD